MEVLLRLAESAGETVSKDEIIRSVWPDMFVGDDVLSRAIYELRKAFGDDPHQPQIIQTIAKRGYRLIAPVERPEPAAVLPIRRSWLGRHWKVAAGAVIAAVLAIATAVAAWLWNTGSAGKIGSVAVLPFVNATSDANDEYLSDGLTDELITTLSQLPNIRVMARSTVFRFKGKEDDPAKLGQWLKVDAVLTGRIVKRGQDLGITTDLVNVADGTEIWGAQYTRGMADLATLQEEITRDVAARLRAKLTGEQQKNIARATTANPQAYREYLKGRYYWNKRGRENLLKSIESFQQAIAADPGYALAYAGLADVYTVAPGYSMMESRDGNARAVAAARKAVELDPQLAEGHGALAAALADAAQWQGAEREFRRALESAPNNPDFRYLYGYCYLLPMGQFDAALAEIRSALTLDPFSLIVNTNYAYVLVVAHRYDEALQQFRTTLELDPNFGPAHIKLARLYASMGRYADAISEERKAWPRMPAVSDNAKGYALVRKASNAELAKTGYVPEMFVAMALAVEGDRDGTLLWLQKAVDQKDTLFASEVRNPLFDFIRSDERYISLMRGIGLPP